MNTSAMMAFVAVMVILAAIPSASVALVVTRSAILGFKNGLAVTAGIVMADLLLATLAIVGMAALAQSVGAAFVLLRYAAGIYIIYLGIVLIRSRHVPSRHKDDVRPSTLCASLISGFLLTLGDLKAILFYASLFPALFDLRVFTLSDYFIIAAITVFTVGGVKSAYAGFARRLALTFSTGALPKHAKTIAGGILTGTGILVITQS